ncbi:MAG: YacC family pilotin-like protein [Enterobacteriaceae bacterium]
MTRKLFFAAVTLFLSLLTFNSLALSELEAEDLADLTAIFVYLKTDCGYSQLPNAQIKRAIVYFAQQSHWDLSNYSSFDMKQLGEDSYKDLSGISVPQDKKCTDLAKDTLGILAYVN